MTLRAIAGLVGLNVVTLAVGAVLLWGIRAWRRWTELACLAGVAYLLGVASLAVVLTLELVVGVPFGLATFLVTAAALAACGIAFGVLTGSRRPTFGPVGWRLPQPSLLVAVFTAGIVVYLAALFRASRLSPLWEFDAWWVWTIRAKELYLTGDIGGTQLVREEALSYPLSLSLLHAEAFEAMGGMDVVTLRLQHWFLAVGFVAAFTGLLVGRVRGALLLPVVLLVLAIPSFADQFTWVAADPLLAYQLAIAALLLFLWLEDRASWRLVGATALLGGAVLTKREGILFVACVLAAAAAASWRERRWAWPRLTGSAAIAVATWLPWQLWVVLHGSAAKPSAGYLGALDHLDRVWPALSLVVGSLMQPRLLGVLAFVLVSAALALWAGERRLPVFTLTLTGLSTAVVVVVFWSEPLFALSDGLSRSTPMARTAIVVMLPPVVLMPPLLDRAWTAASRARASEQPERYPLAPFFRPRPHASWLIVVAALLVTPAFVLAAGPPRFPSASECVTEPAREGPVRVVVGYADAFPEAELLETRAAAAGLPETSIQQDGCGRLRVFTDLSAADVRRVVRLGEAAGLAPTLEVPSRERRVVGPSRTWAP